MKKQRKKRKLFLIGFLMLIIVALLFLVRNNSYIFIREFPEISPKLSLKRQKILTIAKQEYEHPHNQTYYSQGIKEAWCADFVSWIFMKADYPFANPNSGSWRIPGTMTLLDYFRSTNEWQPYNAIIKPSPGDVVIYDTKGRFGQHTNIVVAVNNNKIITVDGNSANTIRLSQYDWTDRKMKILGYADID